MRFSELRNALEIHGIEMGLEARHARQLANIVIGNPNFFALDAIGVSANDIRELMKRHSDKSESERFLFALSDYFAPKVTWSSE